MEITELVSKGLNHLEVKYDVPWWDIKKWKSDESYEFVTKLIENHPEDKVLKDLQSSLDSISQDDYVTSVEKYSEL
ncbi:hypothetical protein N9M11_04990 [Flavobacteriaceae bacterium]|jgi:hypothetical protein|uniref:hypothetical protein n=1 Tax=Candidatus Arcticimaribacter forsetii TaxID=2820661 RepID=UPI0020770AB5|nr:hypothetical protein [Candidatus Arcticimaribacter forsetii]MDA8699448.1 hypothetical protein [Flavobacteriaceae bacterium]MDB2326059.1 hypothetical protein [Flavobacteriaceae bacterium]MDB2329463.1 hypothetical protein [Flavobacteriaceae bacterium]MDB2346169.1 hypothetical protein [Flavobacteriaceae bacterium]